MHLRLSFFILVAVCIVSFSCAPKHYYSSGYINNPNFNLFGASLSLDSGKYIIKSYIQSSKSSRTEYIYENFDISFPDTFALNQKFKIENNRVYIWYARGGQAGQIETTKGTGTFKILSMSKKEVKLELEIELQKFSTKGSIKKAPERIHRKGILTAKKGYKLFT